MRVPTKHLIQKLSRLIVFFILGILVGAILFLYMHGQKMDEILLENRQLRSDIADLRLALESAEEDKKELNQRNQQRLLIKNIEIEIIKENNSNPDGFTESEVKDRLKKDLKFLISMPLDSVAETSDTITHLIDGRKYELNQREIGLKLETLVIYTTITIKVSIEKIK